MTSDGHRDPHDATEVAATEPEVPADASGLPEQRLAGYTLGGVIGRGGMGEVVVARDLRIGRDVALKRMRGTNVTSEQVDRFLREARIQALLDHPAVVPVHELGHDNDGRPYFTMKRLVGTTLADLLASRKEPRKRLLRALVDVCLAIDLAHTKSVVHRDLKPSNIMLGDYGEVYVLDWGVARLLHGTLDTPAVVTDVDSLDGETATGTLLGTPGYMSPEQIRSEEVTPAADVYALGSILFEILAEQPLHPRGHAALAATLEDHDRSVSRRRPDLAIAPELDALCADALAPTPSARPTARQLADGLQAYLDGDRDRERRRAFAAKVTSDARVAFERGDRVTAIQLAGRALGLDPRSHDAAELAYRTVTEDIPDPPAELVSEIEAEERRSVRERSRRAITPMLTFFAVAPLSLLLHVADWRPLVALLAAAFAAVITLTLNARRGVPLALKLLVHGVLIVACSRLSGPLVITPIVMCAMLLAVAADPWLGERRWALFGWTLLTLAMPFVLESAGVLATTWQADAHGVISRGTIFAVSHPISVIAANIGAVAIVAAYARRIARDRRVAQRRLLTQAWHLRQLLPTSPRAASGPATAIREPARS